jgi:hypothetical protein
MNVRNGTGGSSSNASTRPFASRCRSSWNSTTATRPAAASVKLLRRDQARSRCRADQNRLFLAFNLLYQPAATRAAVGGDKKSTLVVSSALAFQIVPNVVVGVDLWYLRHYQGVAFNSLTGDAVYLGPTFFWKIAPRCS